MESSKNQDSNVRWIVMGVCGCGKSTVGQALAASYGVPYVEGDLFHPDENVAKMRAGIGLDDDDRSGWLRALMEQVRAAREEQRGLVVACSALKRRYRDLLREGDPDLRFAHLHGERDVIAARLNARTHHYMPPTLLASQLKDLEHLGPDEEGIRLDIGAGPEQLVEQIRNSALK